MHFIAFGQLPYSDNDGLWLCIVCWHNQLYSPLRGWKTGWQQKSRIGKQLPLLKGSALTNNFMSGSQDIFLKPNYIFWYALPFKVCPYPLGPILTCLSSSNFHWATLTRATQLFFLKASQLDPPHPSHTHHGPIHSYGELYSLQLRRSWKVWDDEDLAEFFRKKKLCISGQGCVVKMTRTGTKVAKGCNQGVGACLKGKLVQKVKLSLNENFSFKESKQPSVVCGPGKDFWLLALDLL